MKNETKRRRRWPLFVLGLLVGLQLVPVDRENPPPGTAVAAPAEVRAVLERACFDVTVA